MDTQNAATAEIPNFKLAKVGKDRERKRGGGGWLSGGRGAGSAFSGATGGAGFGAGAMGAGGMTLGKALLVMLITAGITGASWQYGKYMSAKYSQDQTNKGNSKLFANKGDNKYDDLSGVIRTDKNIPNGPGYVSGSLDGMTPEERAKKAAEDEAARKAAEDAAKKADADASKVADATPASSPIDPAALAAGAAGTGAGEGKKLMPSKFGASAFGGGSGGGLSGGSGLSGGINRNFAGAAGAKPQNGALSSFKNTGKASSTAAAKGKPSNSKSKGFAKRQLDNAFAQSRAATSASKGETASSSAAAPFDNNTGGGTVIAGPGVGNGRTAPADAGGSTNPTNTGGPLDGGNGAACQSSDYAPDVNGVCQKINTSSGKSAAPYQSLIDMAKMLMAITSVLALLALAYALSPYTWGIAEIIKKVILAIGVIELALGAAIFAMSGDKMIGGITMAVGALTVASAMLPSNIAGADGTGLAQMAAGTLISNAVGALAASAASKSQLH